jgi:hypothetical protein
MNETDIPYADCGTELVEQTVHVRDLPVSTNWQGPVRIAHSPAYEVRYSPEQALSQPTGSANDSHLPGES